MNAVENDGSVWPHAKLMGAQFVGFDHETATVTMEFEAPAQFITPRGSVQGGLVAGFLDEIMGWAHVQATNGREAPLTLDLNLSLLKPVLQGKLRATGTVVKAGRRVLFLEAELFDMDGVKLARATSTAIPTDRPG